MIKLFRMRSGEDVIGDVESENQEYINLEGPAVLMPVQGNQGGQMRVHHDGGGAPTGRGII